MQFLTQGIFHVTYKFIDYVQDHIRFLCTTLLESYIEIYIKNVLINLKLKNVQNFKR